MKDCTGCRYSFKAPVDGGEADFCRGAPPTAIVVHDGDKVRLDCAYPLRPRWRCGMYKRRWPWTVWE